MYRLTVRSADKEHVFDLDREVVLVGRRAGCDVPLVHPDVAGLQLRLERQGEQVLVSDPGAGRTSTLNGEPLPTGAPRPLADGDVILIAGRFELVFSATSPAAKPTSEARTAELAQAMAAELLGAMADGGPRAAPWLEVIAGPASGRSLALPAPGKSALLGRGETCELILGDPDLSREQLRLERTLTGIVVTELGSKNGSRLGGRLLPVGTPLPLAPGDRLEAGASVLVLHDPAVELLARLAPPPLPEPGPPAPAPEPVRELPAPAVPVSAGPSRWPVVLALLVVVCAGVGLVLLLTR